MFWKQRYLYFRKTLVLIIGILVYFFLNYILENEILECIWIYLGYFG